MNVYMDREYMLEFTREAGNKPWLNRSELQTMTSDPSVLEMIKTIQPEMAELQQKLDTHAPVAPRCPQVRPGGRRTRGAAIP